jgi:Fe2+ or Zn2+ uptake regulation protein
LHSVHRQVEKQLQEAEFRYTKGRQSVVTALVEAGGPLSASELKDALGAAVPLSSLYRSLAVLEEAEVVVPHLGLKGMARYELAEALTGHHHHLICVTCGAVEDVTIAESEEVAVEGIVQQVGTRSSFSPLSHALEIEGRCARCV